MPPTTSPGYPSLPSRMRSKKGDDERPVIALTIGDAAGIGPEVLSEALHSGQLPSHMRYQVIGDATGIEPGKPSTESAQRAMDALNEAVELLRAGKVQGVVTGPIHKAAMYDLGFNFPGQTEFFAKAFEVEDYTMCLSGPHLTVTLATIHVPLREVAQNLDVDNIVKTGRLTYQFCRQRGYNFPRIAVAALNPHGGETGRMGEEEENIISPAVAILEEEMPGVFTGPIPSDTLFFHAYRRDYHAVLCMYHDQGLIPMKMLDFHEGVNITLGLPFPRTSPDHGTAFDIAGKGIARPDSLIASIVLCAQMVESTSPKP